jgi:glycosyltransferase involved in cell wall biosynthesis
MRILHVISQLNPKYGGPPVACASLAAAQAGEGLEVGICAYRNPIDGRDYEDFQAFPGFDRVRLHLIERAHAVETLLGLSASRVLRETIPRYDLVHIHGLWATMLYHAARLARDVQTPYIIAPHGMLDTWALSEKPLKKKLAFALGFRTMVDRATGLHALSPHERDCIIRGGFGTNVQIIPNGVFLQDIDPIPPPGRFRARHPELGEDPYIVFLARLHPVKGLDLLVEAFARLRPAHPRLRLVIAGPDFGAGPALREQIERLGVGDRVHLVGPIYGRERFEAFADAACFALPSKHEGFSMSIAEALASRCPVVITHSCHLPDVAEFQAGEVHDRTVPALTEALERVLSDPERRQRYAANGRRLIEERFTWPAIARRSAEFYRLILRFRHGGERLGGRPGTIPRLAGATPDVAVITNVQTPYRLALHRRLVRELGDVRLWTVYTHGTPDQPWEAVTAEEIRPVHFGAEDPLRAGLGLSTLGSEWRKGGRIIRWLERSNIRAVFLCGYNDAGRMRILRWCRRRGLPVFLVADSNVHGDTVTGVRRWLKDRIVRRAVDWSTLLMPCGGYGAHYFEHYGASPARIVFLPYEPDYALIERLSEDDVRRIAREHGLDPDRPRFVFCGRMVRVKRPDLAVAAFLRIADRRPDWELVLIGDGPERARIEPSVPEALRPRVRWLGFISDPARIGALYRASLVFVLPSDYEPWGVVVNEAAAAGCALVTSSVVGAAGELVRDHINGRTFPPGQLDALARTLLEVSDPANIDRYRTGSRIVLAEWRRRADPVTAMKLALARAGVIAPDVLSACPMHPPPGADPTRWASPPPTRPDATPAIATLASGS